MDNRHGGDIYSHYELKYADKITDFSANLNPFGMPEEIKEAICANTSDYEAYPDTRCRELKAELSQLHNIGEDNICVTNGAADAVYRLAGVLKPRRALIAAPTFSEYEDALTQYGCEVNVFFTDERKNFSPACGYASSIPVGCDIVFLCNPNNPTGIAEDKAVVRDLIIRAEKNGATAVIDECFMEFVCEREKYSVEDLLAQHKNLIILKSFTKMYSMAGIRLGYALCADSALCAKLEAFGQPWGVSTVAQKCGVAACRINGLCDKTAVYVAQQRAYLIGELEKLGCKVFPSEANYIFFRCSDKLLYDKLVEYGILIRRCSNYHGLDEHYYRIAVKREDQNEYFVSCIKKVWGV